MNEFDPTLDEIVSAYVDGVATPDERALVESDPALVERAATFRRVRDALATPPAAAHDDLRHAFVARALAESAPVAPVHALRSRRATTLGPIIAAAAVIALFFGLGTWLVASQENNDEDQTSATASAEDLFDAKSQVGSAAAATTTASNGAGSSAAPQADLSESAKATPAYLGAFADEPALRQAVDRALAGSAPNQASTAPARAAATAASCGRTDPAGARIFTADLRGRPVTLVVVSSTRVDLFDDATCAGPTNLFPVQPPLTSR